MFPAKNGDTFLINCLGKNNTNILLDLAYPDTYRNYVRPRLCELNKQAETLDLVIFTHVDQDHIQGGITFFEENSGSNSQSIITVKEVWHNSYRHLNIGEKSYTLNKKQHDRIKDQSAYVESEGSGAKIKSI
ncbi:hypothetical protein AB3N02_26965 [Priestia aryabhattai]|uniref:hypothetical protein n=1 Tax=Priestia aryabhattai TaxID=412384 RepID=UPI0039A07311